MRLALALFALFSAAAFAGGTSPALHGLAGFDPALIAMGPDPGGHTGAGVTPDTTKTDRPAVDAARKEASGGNVENNAATNPDQPRKSRKPEN
jgi:hypothetical protein